MKFLIYRPFAVVLALLVCAGLGATESGSSHAKAQRALTKGDNDGGVEAYVAAASTTDNIETARQATLTAYDFGFDKLATEAAERWSSLDDTAVKPKLYAAMATLRSGDRKGAVRAWRTVLDTPEAAQTACEFVEQKFVRGIRADDAAWVFDTLAARYRDVPCVVYRAASAAASANDDEAAERWLDRLRDIDAFDDEARLLQIALLIDDEEVDQAFTDETLRLSDAASVRQQVQLALLSARAEDLENAQVMLELLRDEHPDDAEVLEATALVQLQAGEIDASRESFLALLDSGGKTGSALYYLARFAEGQRRQDQALRLYSQIDSGEFVLDAQQRAAFLLSDRSGFIDAIDHLEGFSDRNPRYGLDLSLSRAALYAQNEFYDQALELYSAYLAIRPRAEFALLGKADTLLRKDEIDEAVDVFRGVVKMYPESANALNSLGYTLADRTRKFREAEKLIDKARELEPDNAAIIDS